MRVSGNGGGVGAAGLGHDLAAAGLSDELAAADRLIADLAVLLDAGLVVVDEHILGPARYGVAPGADHREERPHGGRSRQPTMIGGAVLD